MSEAVLIALIGGVQAVTLGVLGILAKRVGSVRRDTSAVREDTAATREQVVNHHTTNLRVENDSRHAETAGWFREIRRDIGGIREELRGLRTDHRNLSTRVDRMKGRS
ncbi:hypothetical protein MRBLWO14_000283 [Microbacterium sp. LWO14-1.2]|uniref:hypothetical protein n=1 Tax=Microbacterium sp. LWO14-1.2 TaxID=3135263 RepID=UPI0031392B47